MAEVFASHTGPGPTGPAPGPTGPGAPGIVPPALVQVNLIVADMERSVAFYRLLGLSDEPIPPEWRPHHRRMTGGGARGPDLELDSRAFAPRWNVGHRPSGGPGPIVLTFGFPTRPAVDEVHDRLVDAGHPSQQPPCDAFWGARYAVVEDPDGNAVGLTSPLDPGMRRPVDPPGPPR